MIRFLSEMGEMMSGDRQSIQLRQAATPNDFDLVREMLNGYAAFLKSTRVAADICFAGLENEIRELPGQYFLVLLATARTSTGEEPVGCVLLRRFDAGAAGERAENACEMKRLWVEPSHRSGGIGRQLIERALETATEQGYSSMYLDTIPSEMASAVKLYEALGFTQVPQISSHVSSAVYYRRSLARAQNAR